MNTTKTGIYKHIYILGIAAILVLVLLWTITSAAEVDIIRPDGDVTTGWAGTTGTEHYTEVDDAVTEPTAGDTTDYVFTGTAGSGGEVEEFNMGTISGVESVSNVKVWMYAKTEACNGGGCDTVDMNVYIGGAYQTAQTKTMTTSWAWYSASFDGTWTQADLDALKVKLTRNRLGGGNPANRDDNVMVATVYVDVTYTPSYNHTTDINVSCDPTDIQRYESTNISGYLTSEGVGLGGKTVNLSFNAGTMHSTMQCGGAYGIISVSDPYWHQFASVITESDGSYNYSWNPAEEDPSYAGWHAIKANFSGDADLTYGPSANTTGYSGSPNLLLNFSTAYTGCFNKESGYKHEAWPLTTIESGTVKGDVFVAWNKVFGPGADITCELPNGTIKSAYFMSGDWGGNEGQRGNTHVTVNGVNVMPMIMGYDNLTVWGGNLDEGYHYCHPDGDDWKTARDTCGYGAPAPTKELWWKYNYSCVCSGCGVHGYALNLTNPDVLNLITMGETNTFHVYSGGYEGDNYGAMLIIVYENSSLNYTQYWINNGYMPLDIEGQECNGGHYSIVDINDSYVNFTGSFNGPVKNATLYVYGLIGHSPGYDPLEFNGYEVTNDTGEYPITEEYNVTEYINTSLETQVAHHYIAEVYGDYNVRSNVFVLKAELE